jgi:nicotinamidase-related amidase
MKTFTEEEVLVLARAAYDSGEASFGFAVQSCALLVIDMQDEFVKPGWTPFWVPEATKQVPKIRALIELCRARQVPVIYTMFAPTHQFLDRPRTGRFMPNRYAQLGGGDPAWFTTASVWHELAPTANDFVIHKSSYGAFYDTSLETLLKNLEKQTVIICGTLTNYCCGTTARQAFERGFRVIFGSDITSTDDPSMQEPELKVLRKGFAKVLSFDEIVRRLQ